ncbi:dynein regulatory complex protein 9-like [Daphnia pulex]|uniref:dynein regulatory complex protein 9-like n=1 Tax=Daphnia pulex TaxID=6669 RepID=UPI001EDEC06F|nr:dynein regulatory complex protein 9-like [Daphnia pulex]
MKTNEILSIALKIVFDRTVDQLIFHEMIQDGNSNSEFSKWRFSIESNLKSVLNEAPGKKIPLLSVHIAEMKAQEEMVMSEKLHLEDVLGQIECDEQDLVNHNMQLHKTSESLNRQICELKDELDRRTESASRSFEHCQNHEVANVNKFLQKFNQDLEEWSGKIATLENEIQLETQRNADEKIKLCTEIDMLTEALLVLRANWEESSFKLTQEGNEATEIRESSRRQISLISSELNKRKLVVNEYQKVKQLAEQENLALIKITLVVIRIQSWWRGVIARRDYARFKLASKKKPRAKAPNVTSVRTGRQK